MPTGYALELFLGQLRLFRLRRNDQRNDVRRFLGDFELLALRRRDAAFLQHRLRILEEPLLELGVRPHVGNEQLPLQHPIALLSGHGLLLRGNGKVADPFCPRKAQHRG
jgi:hypothetical protein